MILVVRERDQRKMYVTRIGHHADMLEVWPSEDEPISYGLYDMEHNLHDHYLCYFSNPEHALRRAFQWFGVDPRWERS